MHETEFKTVLIVSDIEVNFNLKYQALFTPYKNVAETGVSIRLLLEFTSMMVSVFF